jgi:hypothetical protein
LYFEEKQSTKQIAKRYNLAQSVVYNLFGRYGLKTRSLQEAMILQRKPATRYKRVRWRVVQLLGGKCAHCGCDDLRVLEVHHRLGGGRVERRRGGDMFWYNIIMGRRGTSDLELCCKPCHAVEDVKRLYGVDGFNVSWRGS